MIIVVGDRCRTEVLGGACGQAAGVIDGDTVRDEYGVFEARIARAHGLGLCGSKGGFRL